MTKKTASIEKHDSKSCAEAWLPLYANDLPPLKYLDLIHISRIQEESGADDFLTSVLSALRGKDYKTAIDITKKVTKSRQDQPEITNFLSTLYLQSGEVEKAEKLLSQILKNNPHDEKAINNLACVYLHQHDYEKAANILKNGLKNITPLYAQYYYNLAICMYELRSMSVINFLDKADSLCLLPESIILRALIQREIMSLEDLKQILLRGAMKFPQHADIKYYLAGFLYRLGDFSSALGVITSLVIKYPANNYYGILYGMIARMISFNKYQEDHIKAVDIVLNNPCVNTRYLEPAWESLLLHHPVFYSFCYPVADFTLEKAVALTKALKTQERMHQSFLCSGLRHVLNRSLPIERVFLKIRQAFLSRLVDGEVFDSIDMSFLSALALYCSHQEYVHAYSSEEKASLEHLREQYYQDTGRDDYLLCLCTYEPITHWISSDSCTLIQQKDYFNQIIQEQVFDRQAELALMKDIPVLTPIRNDISKAVEQMYMENPYPQWINVTYSGDPAFLRLAPRSDQRHQILIAGCGTGQHSINSALTYENCDVLAIDLSRRSLAYAKRKTNEIGLSHIQYAQADILELGSMSERFDIIESAGVLHHLENPIAGLEILLGLLKPGGLFRFGLYSERARKPVVDSRNFVKENNYAATLEGIRAFRKDIMALPSTFPLSRITEFGDFYLTSTCRDLVFHVQEHRYTIPEIKKILLDHSLEFMGFDLDQKYISEFKALHPLDQDLLNLDYWTDFEEKFPSTFASMYQFWAKKLT